MFAPLAADAVIFYSTADPNYNTTAPTGLLAGSGWQYQAQYSGFLATPVGPNHIVTAAHTAANIGGVFNYNGVTYTTVKFSDNSNFKDFGDIRLLQVDKPILSYAPLWETTNEL